MNRAELTARWHAAVAALRRRTGSPPTLSRWAWTADAILALSVGLLNAAGISDDGSEPRAPQPPPIAPGVPGVPAPPASLGPILTDHTHVHAWQLVVVLAALPLVARRRFPLATLWVVIIAAQLCHHIPGFDPMFTVIGCVIAAYSAVMYSPYQAIAIVSASLGAVLVVTGLKAHLPSVQPGVVMALVLIPVGLAANTIHTWKQRLRTLAAEQESVTRQAVAEERARIAHDLHDVVTHNVSVMVVQAGAARKVMDAAPEQAREALLAVESGGRAAMTELRHAMGLLTLNGDDLDSAASADLAPQPGLDQVPALAARVRDTGVPVELVVTGAVGPLPVGVDLAAYRVIQEALTNTLKHAVGARVRITVDRESAEVRLEVVDTGGTAAPSARAGNGRGLVGLRERLAVYGGTLETGERPLGGYRLFARIPTEGP